VVGHGRSRQALKSARDRIIIGPAVSFAAHELDPAAHANAKLASIESQ
jgi:hypothetical protein